MTGVEIKSDVLEKRIKEDGRPLRTIAKEAGMSPSAISAIKKRGRGRKTSIEALRLALQPKLRARSIYKNAEDKKPQFKRTASDDMCFIERPGKFEKDAREAGYSLDKLSEAVGRSRKYFYTEIHDGCYVSMDTFEKACDLIGHDYEEYMIRNTPTFEQCISKAKEDGVSISDLLMDLFESEVNMFNIMFAIADKLDDAGFTFEDLGL